MEVGSGGRTRTYDQVINSHPLYQLSYAGTKDRGTHRHLIAWHHRSAVGEDSINAGQAGVSPGSSHWPGSRSAMRVLRTTPWSRYTTPMSGP